MAPLFTLTDPLNVLAPVSVNVPVPALMIPPLLLVSEPENTPENVVLVLSPPRFIITPVRFPMGIVPPTPPASESEPIVSADPLVAMLTVAWEARMS